MLCFSMDLDHMGRALCWQSGSSWLKSRQTEVCSPKGLVLSTFWIVAYFRGDHGQQVVHVCYAWKSQQRGSLLFIKEFQNVYGL